jgi:hypothetical protein
MHGGAAQMVCITVQRCTAGRIFIVGDIGRQRRHGG